MLQETMIKLHFPQEAIGYFDAYYREIIQNEGAIADMQRAKEMLFSALPLEDHGYLDILQKVAEDVGFARGGAEMLFFLWCIDTLQEKYKEKGLPEGLLWDTLQDLQYKLIECKTVYGYWGTFVAPWFRRFYLCERFAFGRLQFETIEFTYEGYKGLVKRGDTVYNCHIPSSGPLYEGDVLASFKRVYEYYKPQLKGELMPIVCHSWLLYEPFEEVFEGCENLQKFRALFDLVENTEEPKNGDFWRVFGAQYSFEYLQTVEPKTRLQRNLKKYLLSGKNMGYAYGILLFDGERIVK